MRLHDREAHGRGEGMASALIVTYNTRTAEHGICLLTPRADARASTLPTSFVGLEGRRDWTQVRPKSALIPLWTMPHLRPCAFNVVDCQSTPEIVSTGFRSNQLVCAPRASRAPCLSNNPLTVSHLIARNIVLRATKQTRNETNAR